MENFYSFCEPNTSGTEANMHFSSYLPPCYFIPSPGRPLPLRDGDITRMSRNGCTSLVQPSSFNHNVIYEREITRQAMLNHEAAFRYQVCELHHLYSRQKELMAEHRMRDISGHQLQYHRSQSDRLLYSMQPDISQKTVPPWLLVNAEGCVASLQDERYPQRPSFVGDSDSFRPDNKLFFTRRSPAYNEGIPPRINQFGKRMLDLEHPTNLYIQRDEEDNRICKNIIDVPPTLRPLAKETPEFHLESVQPYPFDTTGSLHINSKRGGTKLCIDLNEPIQLDDESNSATCSTQTVHLSPVASRKPVNNSNATNEDNAHKLLSPREKHVEGQPLNSEAQSDKIILVQNSSAEGNSLGSNISCESDNLPMTLGSCILFSSQLVPHSADTEFTALSSVTSQRKSPCDLREVPVAVKPLPCLNTTKMNKDPKPVYESYRNYSNTLTVKKNSANNADIGKEPFQVHPCLAKKMKNSHDHELLEYVDLNCMPLDLETLSRIGCKEDCKAPYSSVLTLSGSFDDQPSLPSPTSCKLVLSISGDNEEVGDSARSSCDAVSVKNDEVNITKDTDCKQLHCSKELNSYLDEDMTPAASSQSAKVIKHQGSKDINIEAPASPENSECYPPRGKSQDKVEIPLDLPKEAESNIGELDKIAAEAILQMSLSRGAKTPEPSRPLDICLNWFARIVSSVSEDLCYEIKKLSNKAADSDDKVLRSFRTTDLETKKARVRRTKDATCRGKKQNKQGETYECFPRQQGHGRRSKQPRIVKEKYLHDIGMGKISDVAFARVKRRKRNAGNGFSKLKPYVNIIHHNDLDQLINSSPICNAKAKIVGNRLQGWGLRTGRRKARRGRQVFDVFLHLFY